MIQSVNHCHHHHHYPENRVNPRAWPLELRVMAVALTIFLTFEILNPLLAFLISGVVFADLILNPLELRFPSLTYSIFQRNAPRACCSSPSFFSWNVRFTPPVINFQPPVRTHSNYGRSFRPHTRSWWPSWFSSSSRSHSSSYTARMPTRRRRHTSPPVRTQPSATSTHLSTAFGTTRRRVSTPKPVTPSRTSPPVAAQPLASTSQLSTTSGKTRRRVSTPKPTHRSSSFGSTRRR